MLKELLKSSKGATEEVLVEKELRGSIEGIESQWRMCCGAVEEVLRKLGSHFFTCSCTVRALRAVGLLSSRPAGGAVSGAAVADGLVERALRGKRCFDSQIRNL